MKNQSRRLVAVFLLFALFAGVFSMPVEAAGASAAAEDAAGPAGGTSALITSRTDSHLPVQMQSATWKKVDGHLRLRSSSGKYKTGFVKHNGRWYYFDSKGNLVTDFFTVNGKTYFGSLLKGEKGMGELLTGLVKIRRQYYYFNPKSSPYPGVMMTGFQTIRNNKYYFNKKGRLVTGWFTVGGFRYYGNPNKNSMPFGALLTGTHKIGSKTYYFDSSGRLVGSSDGSSKKPSALYSHMIDVSEHQGSIDFNRVKSSGIKAVMIRAGYGNSNVDKHFYKNIKKAKAAGLPIGIYWFSYAHTKDQAINEAKFCLRVIKAYSINLPVYFDWEYDSMRVAREKMGKKKFNKVNWRSRITEMTSAFCKTITNNGRRAGYYFNLDYHTNYYNPSQLTKYSTWYAFYGKNKSASNIWAEADKMTTPSEYDMWQFSSRGHVSGISGYVDCDLLLHPGILH
ncbi:MAG: GH25 family lysozyme [Eubacteriales bacterium]|nr:GH25 family lysozyme [Eubacteriales bacterium]